MKKLFFQKKEELKDSVKSKGVIDFSLPDQIFHFINGHKKGFQFLMLIKACG